MATFQEKGDIESEYSDDLGDVDPLEEVEEEEGTIVVETLDDDDEDEIGSNADDDTHVDLIAGIELKSHQETYKDVISGVKRTRPFITRFELTKVLGIRAQQLENNAAPMIQLNDELMSATAIAQEELKQRVIPLMIRRHLPDGQTEDWRLDEFSNY